MDKSKLLSPRADTTSGLPEDTVDVPGMGTVCVRGLNRIEALIIGRIEDLQTRERKTLAVAMVDPALTEREAGEWQKVATGGEIDPVVNRILQLSGMLPEQAKEVYREFEADPDTEFRALPSAEAGDDGGTAPAGDE